MIKNMEKMICSNKDTIIIKKYLEENGVYEIPNTIEKLKYIVQLIANIPWGEARKIDEVVKKNKGTCTGKHKLLQSCLNELGIPNKSVLCTFHWSDKKLKNFPIDLQKILDSGEWEHGHNFVKLLSEGKWIDVDITFDRNLKDYGFASFPEDWDGKTSFISVNPIRRWDDVDIDEKKKELINELSDEMKVKRKEFLRLFFEWVEKIRKQ